MPLFKNELTVGDLIQAIAVLLAAAGLVFSALQTKRANRQSRAQQVIDLHGRFLDDPALVDAYYKIEYQEFEYGDGFHGSELEKHVDRLLQCFENMATLVDAGVLEASDLDPVAYHYLVIYQDAGVQRYFQWLDEWYVQRGMDETPFGVFRKVGVQLEIRRYRGRRPSNRALQPTGGAS